MNPVLATVMLTPATSTVTAASLPNAVGLGVVAPPRHTYPASHSPPVAPGALASGRRDVALPAQ
jgi:hypothetical protein